jgi:hypothetical protein
MWKVPTKTIESARILQENIIMYTMHATAEWWANSQSEGAFVYFCFSLKRILEESAFKPIRAYGFVIESSYERNFVMRGPAAALPKRRVQLMLRPVMLCYRECKGNETMSLSLFKKGRFVIMPCDTISVICLAFYAPLTDKETASNTALWTNVFW